MAESVSVPAGRRRPRALVPAIVAVAALAAAAAAIVAWAPWKNGPPPAPARPAGLSVVDRTFHSITITWSRPRRGPRPRKYEIFQDGEPLGSVSGQVTTYKADNLSAASAYTYRLRAVRGQQRSAESAPLAARTDQVPPVDDSVLTGTWLVGYSHVSISSITTKSFRFDNWVFTPGCQAGPCSVKLAGQFHGTTFKTFVLHRKGAVYSGKTTSDKYLRCNGTLVPVSLAYKLKITAGSTSGVLWLASTFTGSVDMTYPGGDGCDYAQITADIHSVN